MLISPSDRYGDLSLEDLDETEPLEPDDEEEINPLGRFRQSSFDDEPEDLEDEEYYDDSRDYGYDEWYEDDYGDESDDEDDEVYDDWT